MQGDAPRVDSLAMRAVVFFAVNPTEELATGDLMAKFAQKSYTATWKTLNRAVEMGWLSRRRGPVGGRGMPQNIYSAGPALLSEVGVRFPRARTHDTQTTGSM